MGGSPGQVDLPGEEAQALAATARASGYENLLRLMNLLLTSEPIVRRSDTGALAVEIAWLRAAELPKLTRVEEILAGSASAETAAGAAAAPRPAAPAPAPAPPRSRAPEPPPGPPRRRRLRNSSSRRRSPAETAPPRAEAPHAARLPPPDARRRAGRAIRSPPSRKRPASASRTSAASSTPPRTSASRTAGSRSSARAATPICGAGWTPTARSWRRRRPRSGVRRPDLISWRAAARPRPAAAEAKTGPVQQVEQIPTVQAVLDIFKGRIETVEEHGSYTED